MNPSPPDSFSREPPGPILIHDIYIDESSQTQNRYLVIGGRPVRPSLGGQAGTCRQRLHSAHLEARLLTIPSIEDGSRLLWPRWRPAGSVIVRQHDQGGRPDDAAKADGAPGEVAIVLYKQSALTVRWSWQRKRNTQTCCHLRYRQRHPRWTGRGCRIRHWHKVRQRQTRTYPSLGLGHCNSRCMPYGHPVHKLDARWRTPQRKAEPRLTR